MNRSAALGIVGALLLTATGCSGPDAVMREFVINLNALAESIEKKEPIARQQAASDRVRATIDKIDKLKLSEADGRASRSVTKRKSRLRSSAS